MSVSIRNDPCTETPADDLTAFRYHYVQRDLDNCLMKLARAAVVRKGGWREQAGAEGCKDYEMYEDNSEPLELFETKSFCKFSNPSSRCFTFDR